jgi:hypothetical protein
MVPPLGATSVENGTVLMAITLIVLPIAAIAFARSGAAWRNVGKGPFAIDQDLPEKSLRLASPVDPAVQAAEARQMLEAKSYRRSRRGEAPLDIEREVEHALDSPTGPPPSLRLREELQAEVRHLVVTRNERRMRRGQAPLDVEAETERQLADFIGSE